MLSQIVSALGVVVGAVIACSAYFYFSNKILDLALPVKDGDIRAASRNLNRRALVRPWLFIGPALFLLIVYLVYPVVATLILSFYDRAGLQFVGLANYKWA
ncbi:alpha-glucoside ABC transporter permease, partial [Rhizobium ruizarguesonis]